MAIHSDPANSMQLHLPFAVLEFAILSVCAPSSHPYSSAANPNEADLDNHQTYRNHDGNTVHSPAHSRSGDIPSGATAQCRDGTWSFSQHRSGTCSRHGG